MRKNTLFLAILFFPLMIQSQSINAQLLFNEANTVLEAGNFDEALSLYKTIEDSGYVSGALFLNIGFAAVQIDSLGLAKYYFLKAQKYESMQNDTEKALDYVNAQFSRQSAQLPKLPWEKAVHWAKESPTVSGIYLFGFLILNLGLLLLLINWLKKLEFSSFKLLFRILTFSGFSIILLAFYVDYVDARYDEAVLITSQSNVYSSPDSTAELVSTAYEGYDLIIDNKISDSNTDWFYIRLGNGQYGWISKKGIAEL